MTYTLNMAETDLYLVLYRKRGEPKAKWLPYCADYTLRDAMDSVLDGIQSECFDDDYWIIAMPSPDGTMTVIRHCYDTDWSQNPEGHPRPDTWQSEEIGLTPGKSAFDNTHHISERVRKLYARRFEERRKKTLDVKV